MRQLDWRPTDWPAACVAVVDLGSLLSIATMFGAARIGGAAALMNPALTPPELRGLVVNAGCADVGVAGATYAERLREAGLSEVLTDADLFVDGETSVPPTVDDVADRDGPDPVHQRHDRPPEAHRHHQRATECPDHRTSQRRFRPTRRPR